MVMETSQSHARQACVCSCNIIQLFSVLGYYFAYTAIFSFCGSKLDVNSFLTTKILICVPESFQKNILLS